MHYIDYIIQSSLYLALSWLMYAVLFSRLTFFKLNRVYLVFIPVLSLLLPFLDLKGLLKLLKINTSPLVGYIPAYYATDTSTVVSPTTAQVITAIILLSGMLVLSIKLLLQAIALYRLRRSAKLLVSGPVRVYEIDGPVDPFSFGNSIFINPKRHPSADFPEIISHEMVHVRQKHSVDILFSEMLRMLCWFNPFAWAIRAAIRQNLEFLADSAVLDRGYDKKQYQFMLVKVNTGSALNIATPLNFHSLKKRIIMMNKRKSALHHQWRFVLVLPAFVLLLMAFSRVNPDLSLPAILTDTIPAPVNKSQAVTLPRDVQSISITNKRAVVKLNSGQTERYNLANEQDLADFTRKYGPPVPPPPPPKPPVKSSASTAPEPPPPPVPVAPPPPPKPGKQPLPPPPPVPDSNG